jgi:hypothetical protein
MKKTTYALFAILFGVFSVIIVNTKSLPYRIPIGLMVAILNLVFAYFFIIKKEPLNNRKWFFVTLFIALFFILIQFVT